MIEQTINVENALGIHARPASKIVQTASGFKSKISLIKDSTASDAKSILHVMMLGANFGSSITIRASGEDEKEAVKALSTLFERRFDED
ncbi:MAG: HPr family phosphocarrier protein [Chitinispirillaceae bacterium]|nr:HPr family phosphocarrier protein [Chitinispirillaceae bacterium]